MQHPILRTKLQRPPVAADILPRARLFERINEGLQRTLTLISAPAGYGKSTLASRWVAECGLRSGWVSLDERDNDLLTFLSYVLASNRSLFPKTEWRTESIAVGSEGFVEKVKSMVGALAIGRKSMEGGDSYQLREPAVPYIAHFGGKKEDIGLVNTYLWNINL